MAAPGMREELRASLLKCFTLWVRQDRGVETMRDVLALAGIEPTQIEQETSWLSVDAARRALQAVRDVMGEDKLFDAAPFVAHAEALGPLVRMVRESKSPMEAYRYLVANAQEQTRVGDYELEDVAPNASDPSVKQVRIVYKARPDEPMEHDMLLCIVRATQLAGLPVLWGFAPAKVVTEKSLGRGDEASVYLATWTEEAESRPRSTKLAIGAGLAGLLVTAPLIATMSVRGAIFDLLIGGATGAVTFTILEQQARSRRLERERSFEKTRIAALERSIELRGEVTVQTQGDLVGTVLAGKYKVGKRIGSGGIGVVHAAEHLGLGTQVAVKVLRGAAAKDGAEIARLRREAQVSSAIDHPNVVKVLDLDTLPDGSIFVVMELLRGRSLAERLHRDGPLAPGQAIQIFRQVSLALAAAHDLGVVHRDLKPGNVFLLDDGETAKVLDFGMSKLAGGTLGNEKLTQDGYTLGTPEYMAPEQCIGAAVEPRTDLYELGVLIYEALTGDLPIKSQNRRDLLDLHQRQVPPPMRHRRPDLPIPRELDEAVAICLRKKIVDRPADARALERMLAAVPLEGVPMTYPRNVGRHPGGAKKAAATEDLRPTEKAR
jgi:serine/threonine-protein kinase